MKLYKTEEGIVIEQDNSYYSVKDQAWDTFVNSDDLYEKMVKVTQNSSPDPHGKSLLTNLLAPLVALRNG